MESTTLRKILLGLIIITLPLSIFYASNTIGLRGEEPRRAIVSLEMFLSKSYIVPKIHGEHYYNKPPLFNWVMLACFTLFHSFEEWVVRFPSLLSLLLTGIFHYFFAKKYLGKENALLASLFFLTAGDIYFYATITAGEIDLFYSLLVYLQVVSIFIFYERKNLLLMFLLSYLFAALGVITKGPPSVAFQGITLLVWFWYNKDLKALFSWRHLPGLLVFIVIAGGYFYAYSLEGNVGGFILRLTKEATQRTVVESKWVPLVIQVLTFPLLLLQLMAPWALLVMFSFRKDWWAQLRSNRLALFSFLFVVSNIPIYCFSSELKNRYIYMFFPFIITILVYFYHQAETGFERQKKFFSGIWIVGMALAVLLFPMLVLVPQLSGIAMLIPKAVLLALISLALLWAYRQYPTERILVAVLFLITLRFGLSFFYLPAIEVYDKNLAYRKTCKDILAITGNQQVFYAQNIYQFNTGIKIGDKEFFPATLSTPTLMAHQVPYYISRSNRKILQYEREMQPGKFYITSVGFIEGKNVEVYYRFRDNWTQNDLVLAKLK